MSLSLPWFLSLFARECSSEIGASSLSFSSACALAASAVAAAAAACASAARLWHRDEPWGMSGGLGVRGWSLGEN